MSVLFRSVGSWALPGALLGRAGLSRVRVPLWCAVLERPDGLVLLDTGPARAQCAWPERDPGRLASALVGLELRPEDALASQLISLGYDPSTVRQIVCTRLGAERAGGVADFPAAHLVVGEWDMARWPHGARAGYLGASPSWLDGRASVLALDGPATLGFACSHDLFGDGTVLALGASPTGTGGLAVAIKLGDGGWAIHTGGIGRVGFEPGAAAMRAALAVAAREPGVRVLDALAHDGSASWPTTRETAWRGAWMPEAAKKKPNGAGAKPHKRDGRRAETDVPRTS